MIRNITLAFAFALAAIAASPALAQQQPSDPLFLQRQLAMTQATRNQLLDAITAAEARIAGMSEELAKAQTRIKELEQKSAAPPKD
jgi:septal ring factor EnvC (AmiA/AmiB activator)